MKTFDKATGTLNVGIAPAQNNTDWYSFSGTSNYIAVVDGSLSYDGYAVVAGKKVALAGIGADDLRQFTPITSGKVYLSAIFNIEQLKTSITPDYFLAFGDAGNSYMCARLYCKSIKEGENYTGFQLGITKHTESTTGTTANACGWVQQTFQPNTNYLVVIEYEFVDGEKNDIVKLYVNPTADTQQPTAQCVQEFLSSSGSNVAAGSRNDATKIASVNLRQGGSTPTKVYVDEIKVATQWSDLFTSGGGGTAVAAISANPTTLETVQGLVGETYTRTFTVNGRNLKQDITLTTNSAEVTLDKTTISKDTATDVQVTATIAPQTANAGSYTITMTSGDVTTMVTIPYINVAVSNVTTIAQLNTTAATAQEGDYLYIKYTGQAVVTYRYEVNGATKLYLQDETAAVFINDTKWGSAVTQGDKVSNFTTYVDASQNMSGIVYVETLTTNVDVISQGNDVTPKEITLQELQTAPTEYLGQLIKIEGVTFETNTPFASGDKIIQDGINATINLVQGNDLIGEVKPAKASITAISSAANGKVLRIRGKQDVVPASQSTDVELIEETEEGEIEIYNATGMRIPELQKGVNIIRKGRKTYKVIR